MKHLSTIIFLSFLSLASFAFSATSELQQAKAMWENGQQAEAIPVFLQYQDTEDAVVWLCLGEAFANGIGVEQNLDKALEYFKKAYDAGAATPECAVWIAQLMCLRGDSPEEYLPFLTEEAFDRTQDALSFPSLHSLASLQELPEAFQSLSRTITSIGKPDGGITGDGFDVKKASKPDTTVSTAPE